MLGIILRFDIYIFWEYRQCEGVSFCCRVYFVSQVTSNFDKQSVPLVGQLSFEIYLLHSLVICSLGCYMALTMVNTFLSVCFILISCIIVVFASSVMLRKADLWLNTYMIRTIDKLLR